MRWLAVLVLLLLVPHPAPSDASGGAGGLLRDPGPGVVESAVEPTSMGAVTTISRHFGEPNVRVAPDGTVYITGFGWQGTSVLRRLPGASSFTFLGYPNAPYGGSDEAVDVAADGTLWISGMYRPTATSGYCASATRSTNAGWAWDPTTPGICGRGMDRQWIAAVSSSEAWLLMHEPCCAGPHLAYRTVDGGVTWSLAGVVQATGNFPGNLFYDPVRDMMYAASPCDLGRGVCVHATPRAAPLPVWAPVGTIPVAIPSGGLGRVTGAVDDAGNLYVTWVQRTTPAENFGIFVARSITGGGAWSPPVRVSGTALGIFPWIVAGADGEAAVVWYSSPTARDPDIALPVTTWTVEAAILHGWSGAGGAPAPVRATLSTTPFHTGAICTLGASCGGNRQLFDFFEADVAPDGDLHVVWPNTLEWTLHHAEIDAGLR